MRTVGLKRLSNDELQSGRTFPLQPAAVYLPGQQFPRLKTSSRFSSARQRKRPGTVHPLLIAQVSASGGTCYPIG
jgi:hypothetical protein